jgi:hypothetical protein
MQANWAKMLLGILLGNLIYFSILPYLPRSLVHSLYTIDAGLALDLLICVLAYRLIRRIFSR